MAPHGPSPVAPSAASTERHQTRRLFAVLVIVAMFFVFELIGAKAAGSDVLEADAYHLLMDVFALAISLGAMRLASSRPNERFTFGLRRAESLAALVNGLLVVALVVELTRDAVEHIVEPTMPKSGLMLIVASVALVVNGFSAWLLHGAMHLPHGGHAHFGHAHDAHDVPAHAEHAHGRHDHACHDHAHGDHTHDHTHEDHGHAHAAHGHHGHAHGHHLNLRGAWLHLIGDALGALAAFAAGLAIRFGASPVVDPIASLVVVAILLIGAVRLLRDAGHVLLEAAPARLSVDDIRGAIAAFPNVRAVRALHVWSLGTGHDAVTVHVSTAAPEPSLGARIGEALRSKFRLEYVTVQVDADGPPR